MITAVLDTNTIISAIYWRAEAECRFGQKIAPTEGRHPAAAGTHIVSGANQRMKTRSG
jgi:hypothetical protein